MNKMQNEFIEKEGFVKVKTIDFRIEGDSDSDSIFDVYEKEIDIKTKDYFGSMASIVVRIFVNAKGKFYNLPSITVETKKLTFTRYTNLKVLTDTQDYCAYLDDQLTSLRLEENKQLNQMKESK